jgi:hypothetical protein
MAIIGLLTVVFQVALELIKIRQAHAAKLGVPRLPADQRKALDAAVLQMVKTKDTSALEAVLKGTDAPPAPAAATPESTQTASANDNNGGRVA